MILMEKQFAPAMEEIAAMGAAGGVAHPGPYTGNQNAAGIVP